MAAFNQTKCEGDVKNTGVGGCPFDPDQMTGSFFVPQNLVLTEAQMEDPLATLQALTLAPKGQRIYPFHGFEALTDNTEDPTFATLASGRPVPIREGNYNWIWQYFDGGLCLSNRLRFFRNKLNFRVLFVAGNTLIGTKRLDSTGAEGMGGIPQEVLYPYPWKIKDFANPNIYRFQFSFKPNYINEDIKFFIANFMLNQVVGLQNINLKVQGTPTGGVFQVIATTGCDGANIFDLYGIQLGVTNLWKMYAASGASVNQEIELTSVAPNAAIKGFTVTADTADPIYTALTATGKVKIDLTTPVALDAADISGFEGVPVEVVRGV